MRADERGAYYRAPDACIGLIMKLPEKVKQIIARLEKEGFEAYAVGGCVRDVMLGRAPGDWDITTSAQPLEVKALFRRTVDTGLQHGTVTVLLGGEGFEVTTYRVDGEYEDFRHPKEVAFTKSLAEDLGRRDFTINAMAYSDSGGLVDMFDGVSDLKNGIIRCVGDAEKRFSEDALRMLRAVRFSAQLGFLIDEDTKLAIQKLAQSIANISAERIQAELVKILTSPNPDYMRMAYELGMTDIVLPEFDAAYEADGERILRTLVNVENDKCLRIAALLCGMDDPVKILRRLKFDNDTIKSVRVYAAFLGCGIEPSPREVRRFLSRAGKENFDGIMKLKYADCVARGGHMCEEKLKRLRAVNEVYQKIVAEEQCVSLKELKITGSELIKIGVPEGRQVGEILSALLDDVIDEPSHNEYEYLLKKAKMLT